MRNLQEVLIMDFRKFVRAQLQFAHGTLEQTIEGCEVDVLHHKEPGSTVNSIAAIYAHAVIAEDMVVNVMLMGGSSLFSSNGWPEKTGVPAKPMPSMDNDWASTINMNLPAFREFAKTVYDHTDQV